MSENWVNLKGFESLYQISDQGNLRSVDRLVSHYGGGLALKKGILLKPKIRMNGYVFFSISKSSRYTNINAHRAVAQHFILNPCAYKEVNHLDGNKENNMIANLVSNVAPCTCGMCHNVKNKHYVIRYIIRPLQHETKEVIRHGKDPALPVMGD